MKKPTPKRILSSILAAPLVFPALTAIANPVGGDDYPESSFVSVSTISSETAMDMVRACIDYAKQKDWKVTVTVLDRGGEMLAFQRMDNTSVNSIQSSQKKANTSLIVRASTRDLSNMAASNATPALVAAKQLSLGFYVGEGGLPILYGNTAVASIGVSGQGPDEDEACAQHAIDKVLKKKY